MSAKYLTWFPKKQLRKVKRRGRLDFSTGNPYFTCMSSKNNTLACFHLPWGCSYKWPKVWQIKCDQYKVIGIFMLVPKKIAAGNFCLKVRMKE